MGLDEHDDDPLDDNARGLSVSDDTSGELFITASDDVILLSQLRFGVALNSELVDELSESLRDNGELLSPGAGIGLIGDTASACSV